MDAFKLECDLPLKKEFIDVQYRQFREKNNGEAAVIQMSDQKWIIHVLFFNKLFQINLNWYIFHRKQRSFLIIKDR